MYRGRVRTGRKIGFDVLEDRFAPALLNLGATLGPVQVLQEASVSAQPSAVNIEVVNQTSAYGIQAGTGAAVQATPTLQGAVTTLTQTAQPIIAPATPIVQPVVEPVAQVLGPATTLISETVAPLTSPVQEVLQPVVPIAQPLFTPVVETLQPATPLVGDAVAPLTPVVEPIIEPLKPAIAPVAEVVEPVAAPVLQPVKETFAPVLEPVTPVMDPVLEAAQPITEVVQPVDILPEGTGVKDVIGTVPGAGVIDEVGAVVPPGISPEPGDLLSPNPDLSTPGDTLPGATEDFLPSDGLNAVPDEGSARGAVASPAPPPGPAGDPLAAAIEADAETRFVAAGEEGGVGTIGEAELEELLAAGGGLAVPADDLVGQALQGGDLAAVNFVFSLDALDEALRQVLLSLESMGRRASDTLSQHGLMGWLASGAAALLAVELLRRHAQARRRALKLTDDPSLTWVPGMPGSFSAEDA